VNGASDRKKKKKKLKDFSAILNFARHVLFLQVGHGPLELFDLSFYSVENREIYTIFHGVCIWHHDLRVLPHRLKISRTLHFSFSKTSKQTNKQTSEQKQHYFQTSAGISQLINQRIALVDLVPYVDSNYAILVSSSSKSL